MGTRRDNRLRKRLAEVKPCGECRPSGGNWQQGERGMQRCACLRGQLLAKLDRMNQRAGEIEVGAI